MIFTILYQYWKKQSLQFKSITIALGIAIIYITFLSVKIAVSEYRQYKFIKSEIKRHTTQIDSLKIEQIKLLEVGKQTNYKAKRKSTNIDAKLKQDEKDIDNNVITDDERKKFLSRYD